MNKSIMSASELINQVDADKDSSNCYEKRLEQLKAQQMEYVHIAEGIDGVLRALDGGSKSFVVYGEPQSGKTEFMIALVCKMLDCRKQTIFVLMNDNTELENQNFKRFRLAQELNPSPERDFQIVDMDPSTLKAGRQRVIFCRKNAKNLEKLIHACRFMEDRVVIDDEADYATPNAKINKDDFTAINQGVESLGDLTQNGTGVYIGVTATPGRLDLNNTFLNDSIHWVYLRSHSKYKGRNFFFPATDAEREASNYNLFKLPDDTDPPELLRYAVFRFMLRVAMLNQGAKTKAYSMLIHTAGKTNDHIKDNADVLKILHILRDSQDRRRERYVAELLDIANQLVSQHQKDFAPDEISRFILKNLGRSEVLVINHKNDKSNVERACEPTATFTFAIGGNIVSRGLTFKNLLTFYFSRTVKGRLQQNTYIQRARMFGNRPYSEYFELCVPETLFTDWANVFEDHELSVTLGKAGAYQHIQSVGTAVIDAAAIDKKNVTMEKSERPVGAIFDLTEELEQRLVNHDGLRSIRFLENLIEEGLIDEEHFPRSLIMYLREKARSNESDVLMVLRTETDGELQIQNIERYKDGDVETITRARGGIVHAMLNKRSEYQANRHFILPIKNLNGRARFMYKTNTGHSILQNLLAKK
jgi:hypothetical protein